MMGEYQIRAARISEDSYSFDNVFQEIAPILKRSDLVIGNLETTLSGREAEYVKLQRVRKTWPLFNCPD